VVIAAACRANSPIIACMYIAGRPVKRMKIH
jgi:hypothetical protein